MHNIKYYALLSKNHFLKVFDCCVGAVSENNQPMKVKIHPLVFLYSQ